MPRTRTRPVPVSVVNYTSKGVETHRNSWVTVSEATTDEVKPPCSLRVFKRTNVSNPFYTAKDGSFAYCFGHCGFWLPVSSSYRFCVEPYLNRLKPSKLPTHNKADLLTNLAEFDDTLAMFGKNLKSSASYGGYKWGWAPLLGDIAACNDAANAVKNSVLDGSRRTSRYVTTDSFETSYKVIKQNIGPATATIKHSWDVKVKYSGSVSYENDLLAFYDYMGFHPSPKLIWDLVPLSFAVDWVLPVGDILQSITPSKGWVKSANFTGWRTITATVRETYEDVELDSDIRLYSYAPEPDTFVYRDYLHGVAMHEKKIPKPIELIKIPNLEQAFDLAYLSKTFYSKAKNLVSPHVSRRLR